MQENFVNDVMKYIKQHKQFKEVLKSNEQQLNFAQTLVTHLSKEGYRKVKSVDGHFIRLSSGDFMRDRINEMGIKYKLAIVNDGRFDE